MAIVYNTLQYLCFIIYYTKNILLVEAEKKNKKDWKQIPYLLQANYNQTGFFVPSTLFMGSQTMLPVYSLESLVVI